MDDYINQTEEEITGLVEEIDQTHSSNPSIKKEQEELTLATAENIHDNLNYSKSDHIIVKKYTLRK